MLIHCDKTVVRLLLMISSPNQPQHVSVSVEVIGGLEESHSDVRTIWGLRLVVKYERASGAQKDGKEA